MTIFDKAINKIVEDSDSKTPRFDLICYNCEVCRKCPIKKEICEGRSPYAIEKILMEECNEL